MSRRKDFLVSGLHSTRGSSGKSWKENLRRRGRSNAIAKTIENVIRTRDESGDVITETEYSQEWDFPTADENNIGSIDGFLNDFDKMEKAVLSSRKNTEKKFVEAVLASEKSKNGKTKPFKVDAEIGCLNVLLSHEASKNMPPKKSLLSLCVQGSCFCA